MGSTQNVGVNGLGDIPVVDGGDASSVPGGTIDGGNANGSEA